MKRAMNNREKANAAMLKNNGFHIFWQYNGPSGDGNYWAIHPKLVCQYDLESAADEALMDYSRLNIGLFSDDIESPS